MIRRGGCDIDDVLALTRLTIFNKLQGQDLLRNRNPEEDRCIRIEDSFREEISSRNVLEIFRSPGLWQELEACPFLVSGLQECAEQGVEIHLITARTEDYFGGCMTSITADWLARHRIYYSKLAFVPAEKKAAYCEQFGLDFMIEDRLDTAIAVAQTLTTQAYLVSCPHNQMPKHPRWPLHRVRNMSRPYYQNFYQRHYTR